MTTSKPEAIQLPDLPTDAPIIVVPPHPYPGAPTLTTDDELRAYSLAHAYVGAIAYAPDAALMKWARLQGWGAPIGGEFRYFNANGQRMAAQAFALRIATCVEGEWDRVTGVLW